MSDENETVDETVDETGEDESAAPAMVLDPAVDLELSQTRRHVAGLVALVSGQGEADVAIAGAGSKFLAETELARIARKANRKPRRQNDPKLEEGWVTLRFRITEQQRAVVEAACDKVLELSGKDKKGAYKGWALEMCCADFLAGHGLFLGSRATSAAGGGLVSSEDVP